MLEQESDWMTKDIEHMNTQKVSLRLCLKSNRIQKQKWRKALLKLELYMKLSSDKDIWYKMTVLMFKFNFNGCL